MHLNAEKYATFGNRVAYFLYYSVKLFNHDWYGYNILNVFYSISWKRQDFCTLKEKTFNVLPKSKFPKIGFCNISWFDMSEVFMNLSDKIICEPHLIAIVE